MRFIFVLLLSPFFAFVVDNDDDNNDDDEDDDDAMYLTLLVFRGKHPLLFLLRLEMYAVQRHRMKQRQKQRNKN